MSVYFATCREVNAVKIGSSVDPWGRLPEIQLGCPLKLTIEAILPGDAEEEFKYHAWFADDRIRGEWFTLTPMIETIIANNPATPEPERKVRTVKASRLRTWPRACEVPLGLNDRLDRERYEAAMRETRALDLREPGA